MPIKCCLNIIDIQDVAYGLQINVDVEYQADSFQRQGRQLRRKMWLQNLQMKLIIGGAIFVSIMVVWLFICGGFKC